MAFSRYVDNKDREHVVIPDKVNHMVGCLLPETPGESLIPAGAQPNPVTACNDGVVRVIEGATVVYEINVDGVPTSLCLFDAGPEAPRGEMLYGTMDGKFGMLHLARHGGERVWTVPNEQRRGGIQCMAAHDLTRSGMPNVLLGRNDGTVEIFVLGKDTDNSPQCVFQTRLGAGITAVVGGRVRNAAYEEVIVSTYSGHIVSFTTEPVAATDTKLHRHQEIQRLYGELAELEKALKQDREQQQHSLQRSTHGNRATVLTVPLPDIPVNSSVSTALSLFFAFNFSIFVM